MAYQQFRSLLALWLALWTFGSAMPAAAERDVHDIPVGVLPVLAARKASHPHPHRVVKAPLELKPRRTSQKLPPLAHPLLHGMDSQLLDKMVEARLLVVSATGEEPSLSAIKQVLGYLGTPYTLHVARSNPGGITPSMLAEGPLGRYQGIILVTSSVNYFDGTRWRSALTSNEWQALANYEKSFGVRQVTWYTYPTPELGFGPPTSVSTSTTPIPLSVTQAGRQVFSYLGEQPPAISSAYAYLARPASGTVPLLEDPQGHALAAVATLPDGRENLALTFDHSEHHLHSMALAYGLINWVTRGLFIGYRRVYAGIQVDDIFLSGALWNEPHTKFRLCARDLSSTVDWQRRVQEQLASPGFRLDMVYNGLGAEPGIFEPDDLTPAARALASYFKWISHTYTHPLLDALDYTAVSEELASNLQVASRLQLNQHFCSACLVTPGISGLDNPEAMRAARDLRVRYVVSDTSRPGQDMRVPNAALRNPVLPELLMIPRRPTNLFFNVSTPQQWVSEYNHLHQSHWGRDLTYQEILHHESNVLLSYLLRGELSPWMFHQANLRFFTEGHSLLTDLLDTTFGKYRRIYQLPLESPRMDVLGERAAWRLALSETQVTAIIMPGQGIILHASKDLVLPVTGLPLSCADAYGGQPTAFVQLRAGVPLVLPLDGVGIPDTVCHGGATGTSARDG